MYRRIMVPVDGSEPASQGLREAIRLAIEWNATIRLLCVSCGDPCETGAAHPLDPDAHRRSLAVRAEHLLHACSGLVSKVGLTIETQQCEIEHGRVGAAIVHEALIGKCDLIVMGTHGRSGFERTHVVSNAEDVVRRASIPVLIVPWKKGVERRRVGMPSTQLRQSVDSPSKAT